MHKLKSDSELQYINDTKDTDRFNIFHLFNKLKPSGHFNSLNFPDQKLLEFETILKEDHLINQIIKLRDKIYAHTDSNTEKIETNLITFNALKNLIQKN